MSAQYYASFLIRDARLQAVTEYSGVVEMKERPLKALGVRELISLLARNLDVDDSEVEVLQWGPLH